MVLALALMPAVPGPAQAAESGPGAAASVPPGDSGTGATGSIPLAPWRLLIGAAQDSGAGYVRFLHPSALAASREGLYMADAAQGQLIRYDPLTDRATVIRGVRVDGQTRLAAGADLSIYVLDVAGRRLQRFDRDGRLQQTFRLGRELGVAADVAVDPWRGLVYVADRLFNRLVVYYPLGQGAVMIYPKSDTGQTLRGIAAIAVGPDGIYLAEQLRGRLLVFGPEGGMLYASLDHVLVDPAAIAVDRRGRAFVLDRGENVVKIFERGRLVGSLRGQGIGAPGARIAALAIGDDWLYLADAQIGTVQVLRLLPPEERR